MEKLQVYTAVLSGFSGLCRTLPPGFIEDGSVLRYAGNAALASKQQGNVRTMGGESGR